MISIVLSHFAAWSRLVGKLFFVSLSQWDLQQHVHTVCALALQPFPLSVGKSRAHQAKSSQSLLESVLKTNFCIQLLGWGWVCLPQGTSKLHRNLYMFFLGLVGSTLSKSSIFQPWIEPTWKAFRRWLMSSILIGLVLPQLSGMWWNVLSMMALCVRFSEICVYYVLSQGFTHPIW